MNSPPSFAPENHVKTHWVIKICICFFWIITRRVWSVDILEVHGFHRTVTRQWLRLISVTWTHEMPSYLHSYGLSWLLPVENAAGCELRLQGVLLDGGFDWPALTGDDHIGVCTCVRTRKASSQQISFGGVRANQSDRQIWSKVCFVFSPLTSCTVLVLQPLGSVDIDVSHDLWVSKEWTPASYSWLILCQLPVGVDENSRTGREIEFLCLGTLT